MTSITCSSVARMRSRPMPPVGTVATVCHSTLVAANKLKFLRHVPGQGQDGLRQKTLLFSVLNALSRDCSDFNSLG